MTAFLPPSLRIPSPLGTSSLIFNQLNKTLFLLIWATGLLPLAAFAQQAPEARFACMVADRKGTLSGAELTFSGTGERAGTQYTVKSDFQGAAELTAAPGTYQLTIARAGYAPFSAEVTLIPQRLVSKIFALETLADSRLDPTLTTATRTEQYTSEAPATSYVITARQIRDRGYMTLQDVLTDIPEVVVQRYVNPEVQDVIGGRGIMGGEKFLLLQDGIQISSASGDPNIISYNYPVTSARQVEIILGPASALYGADAYAGVINIIADKGEKSDKAPLHIRAVSSVGRFNTRENALTLNAHAGMVRVFANASRYSSNETPFWKFYPEQFAQYPNGVARDTFLSYPSGSQALPADIDRAYATPAAAYSLHSGVQWRGFEAGFSTRKMEHNSSLGDNPAWSVYSAQNEVDNLNQSIYLKHQLNRRSRKWALNSMLWHNSNHLSDKDMTAFINAFTNYRVAYKYNSSHVTRLTEQFTYTFSQSLVLNVGGQYEYVNTVPLSADLPRAFDESLAPQAQHMTYPGTTIRIPFFPLQYHNAGAYGQVRYASAARGLDLLLGGRYDYSTEYGGSFNPRAGIVWHPAKKNRNLLTLKLMYGEGYLAPSPWKAYTNYGIVTTDSTGQAVSSFYHAPNPSLKPEKLHTLEASASYRPAKTTLIAADVYANLITNRILNNGAYDDPLHPVAPMDSFAGIIFTGPVEIPANLGISEMMGATLRWSSVFDLGKNADIEVFASYSFTRGAHTTTDTISPATIWQHRRGNAFMGIFTLANTPVHAFKGGATLTYKRFAVSPRFQWVSNTKGDINSYGDPDMDGFGENFAGQSYYAPGYFVTNVFVRYQALSTKHVRLQAFIRVNNVFDARYYQVYYGGNRGMASVPQDPQRWYAGLTFDFN